MHEFDGDLTGGATFKIRIPRDWNGVLLNDMDFAAGHYLDPSREYLFGRGYGLSGTSRLQHATTVNVEHQYRVLDRVTAEVGEPRATVQIGCSGGGMMALLMAERHSDRIDGAIAQCGTSAMVWRTAWTDVLVIARCLLDPDGDLPVLPRGPEDIGDASLSAETRRRWQDVLDAAQQTPVGRARIALLVTLVQWPTWTDGMAVPGLAAMEVPPDPSDLDAVQDAMFRTAVAAIACSVEFVYNPYPQVSYSNEGVAYSGFLRNADEEQRAAVEALYRAVGVTATLTEDLVRLDTMPRITREVDFDPSWSGPFAGRPAVPLLHVTTMDSTTPPVVTRAYETRVLERGLAERYRAAYVGRANHCGFSIAEQAVMVRTLESRLDSGEWPDVSAAALNARAAALGLDDARFVEHSPPSPHNHAIFAD